MFLSYSKIKMQPLTLVSKKNRTGKSVSPRNSSYHKTKNSLLKDRPRLGRPLPFRSPSPFIQAATPNKQ